MENVIVTDGRSKATIPVVRSLGKRGIKITAGNERMLCPTFFSRYVSKRFVYPSPEEYPDLFIRKLHEMVCMKKYDVLIPIRDAATLLLSKNKNEFSKFVKTPVADYKTIMKGRDKAQTLKIAIKNGIPCPKTYFTEDTNLEEIKREIEYPVLIRARESSGSRGISYVDSHSKFDEEYNRIKSLYRHPLVQEYIPHKGCAYNVSTLFNEDSEPRATFIMRKIRQYPPTGGPTAFAESIYKPEIVEYAVELLKAMKWYGVAEVEFLFDDRDKKTKLLEVNPRFWDPLGLAVASGVDFPYLLYKMAIDGDVDPVIKYKVGIKWRYMIYDTLYFMSMPNKFRTLPQYLNFIGRDKKHAFLSLDDPGPAFGAVLDAFQSLLSKDRREHVFARGWTE